MNKFLKICIDNHTPHDINLVIEVVEADFQSLEASYTAMCEMIPNSFVKVRKKQGIIIYKEMDIADFDEDEFDRVYFMTEAYVDLSKTNNPYFIKDVIACFNNKYGILDRRK